MGFTQLKSDPCLYVSMSEGVGTLVLAVYVDDILITGETEEAIEETKHNLANHFHIKDLKELKYFLGVKMIQDMKNGKVWIGHPLYAENMVREFGMIDAKPVKSPVNPSSKLKKASPKDEIIYQELYQSAYIRSRLPTRSSCPINSESPAGASLSSSTR